LPRIVSLFDDKNNPRVQRHAGAALINFFEYFEKEHISPYLNPILNKLLELLHHSSRDVQEQTISAVAAVAQCAEELFIPVHTKHTKHTKRTKH
jgi:hypothetical protein